MTREFTTAAKSIDFTIDGEKFSTVPAIPAGLVLDLAGLEGRGAIDGFLSTVLEPDSWERFSARLRDRDRPITPETLAPYPYLRSLAEAFNAHPQIKAYDAK